MIRQPPRSTLSSSSAASDVYKRQHTGEHRRQISQDEFEMQATFGESPLEWADQADSEVPELEVLLAPAAHSLLLENVILVDTPADTSPEALLEDHDILVHCSPATQLQLCARESLPHVHVNTMFDRLSTAEREEASSIQQASPFNDAVRSGGWVSTSDERSLELLASEAIEVAVKESLLLKGQEVLAQLKKERLVLQFAELECSIRELVDLLAKLSADAAAYLAGDTALAALLAQSTRQVSIMAALRIVGSSEPGKWAATNSLLRRPVLKGETAVDVHFMHMEGQHDPELRELARYRVGPGGWKVPISEAEFDSIVYGTGGKQPVWLQGDLFASHVFVPELRGRIMLVHEASKRHVPKPAATKQATDFNLPPPVSFLSLFTGAASSDLDAICGSAPAEEEPQPPSNEPWEPPSVRVHVCSGDEVPEGAALVVRVAPKGELKQEDLAGSPTVHWIDQVGSNGEGLGRKLQLLVWRLFDQTIKPAIESALNAEAVEEKVAWWRDLNESTDKIQILLRMLYTYSLEGDDAGSFEGAVTVAPRYAQGNSPAVAATSLVRWHSGVTFGTGFLTGFGGFVTMPITVPTAMLATWMTSARCAFAIGLVCGFDAYHPRVCSTVLHLSLIHISEPTRPY
eukprot:TRINITY_DN12279_c0_g1_i8.p1 TRINITY_DN12279_c0_g1~~TRINITY_DN12279_c0_g1_i8.p1  ORF type:complete len:631 (-),score=154.52 TRINITY_DN12279_c0_g1_i8:85-1977(-)